MQHNAQRWIVTTPYVYASLLTDCTLLDLKCGNVLCRVNDKQQITECVLSDFDSALITGSNVSRKYVSAKSFDVIGTPGCCAPEVLAAGSSSTGYGFPADGMKDQEAGWKDNFSTPSLFYHSVFLRDDNVRDYVLARTVSRMLFIEGSLWQGWLRVPLISCLSLSFHTHLFWFLQVCAGTKPVIPPDHPQEYDGLIRLMHLCLSMEPGDRPSARCVTKDLTELEYAHCNGAGTASTAPANGEPCWRSWNVDRTVDAACGKS